jgi:hypothetical protein
MTVDTAVSRTPSAPKPNLAAHRGWSGAELFEEHLPDGLVLRALVCSHRGGAEWRWTVGSLDQDRGELIGAGIEKTPARARRAAAAELAKCLENGMV